MGIHVQHENFFDTIRLVGVDAKKYFYAARHKDLTLLMVDESTIGISVDESTAWSHLAELANVFGARVPKPEDATDRLRNHRTSSYLEHPVFNSYHSETAMLRYLKKLDDFDYALDRGMIPLGSCTMKLNSVT